MVLEFECDINKEMLNPYSNQICWCFLAWKPAPSQNQKGDQMLHMVYMIQHQWCHCRCCWDKSHSHYVHHSLCSLSDILSKRTQKNFGSFKWLAFTSLAVYSVVDPAAGYRGPRKMKSMQPPSAAIFFTTNFFTEPRGPWSPLDSQLLSTRIYHTS